MSKNGFWLLCLLLPLAGCGFNEMQGNWVLREVTPPAATGHYDIAAATFNPDYTYLAKIRKGDRTEISRGTYDYDHWSRKLTLRSAGIERSYTVTIWLGMQINVESQTSEGKPLTAIMTRSDQAVLAEPSSSKQPTQ